MFITHYYLLFMKIISIAFLLSFVSLTVSYAQVFADVPENGSYIDNGVEYSYSITNESQVKEFNRYEVTLTATNKSGCPLIYIKRNDISTLFEGDPAAIARFECINANGKRLTSKGGNLRARPFFVPNERTVKNAEGKNVTTTERIHAGFILNNGQTVSSSIIVLTDSDRPKFKVRIQNFSDLAAF